MSNAPNAINLGDGDIVGEEDPRAARWREHYLRTEARLSAVLGGTYEGDAIDALDNEPRPSSGDAAAHDARPAITPKKSTRTIDEDDYGDDDEDEDDDDSRTSPLHSKGAANGVAAAAPTTPSLLRVPSISNKSGHDRTGTPSSDHTKTSDDVRKKLQQDKIATEEAARRSFQTMFYPLESDRDAMLEQQKLDELDRQVEIETS
jgi:transcriptional activator SPT7